MIRIALAVAIYAAAIGAGGCLRFLFPKREDLPYVLFRDMVPLIVALPATWLAYCFQRRQSYLHQLRAAWSDAIGAVQAAIRYTDDPRPTRRGRDAVLAGLGAAMDGVQGVFRSRRGVRVDPSGSLRLIRDEVEALGRGGTIAPEEARAARSAIEAHWTEARGRMAIEFDRALPAAKLRPSPAPIRGAGPHRPRAATGSRPTVGRN